MGKLGVFSVVLAVFCWSLSSFGQNNLTIVEPKNTDVLFDSSITFHWNASNLEHGGTTYSIIVASDSALSSVVYSNIGLTNRSDSTSLNPGKYYWQVDLMDAGNSLASTAVNDFTYADIYQLQNLAVFLRADTGLQLSGSNITRWNNLADTSRSAIPPTAAAQPTLQNAVALNNMPVVSMDGVDDLLEINSGFGLGEVYAIANWGSGSSTFPTFNGLITGKSNYFIFTASGASSSFLNPALYPTVSINHVLTRDFSPLADYKILNAKRVNTFNVIDFQIGRDRANSRYWNGGVAEVLGFSAPLSDSLTQIVDAYICKKYSRDISLGEDIVIPYGFCDTNISVDPTYKSYAWSTGDTTANVSLQPGSSYSLTVTDEFGCEFQDEFAIVIPIRGESDQSICLGDTFVWDTELPKADYTFLWTDSSTDSLLSITFSGAYAVTITDSNACSLALDSIQVTQDSTLFGLSLGADTAICQGGRIGLVNSIPAITSYSWSSGDTTPSIQLDTSGTYVLRVSDGKCSISDTIVATIQGVAPTVNFQTTNFFLSDTILFTDLSVAPMGDTLQNWHWDFGDGDTSILQNPRHQYLAVGTYTIRLEVTTNTGCKALITKALTISIRPPTVDPDTTFGTITAVFPINGSLVDDSTLLFRWNNSFLKTASNSYSFQLASDSLLANVLYSNNGIQSNTESVQLPQSDRYYWRVSLQEGGDELAASDTLEFTYANLFQLSDLSMFFRADSGITAGVGGEVQEWQNLADTNNAVQATIGEQPLIINGITALNGQSAIRFDGLDDFMAVNGAADIGELFVVSNWGGGASFPNFNGLMTSQSFNFLIIANGSGGAQTTFSANSFYPNFFINQLSSNDFAPLNEHKIVNIFRSSGAINFSDFFIGKDRNNVNRFWNGDIAEIIGFAAPISDSLKSIVYAYLCEKYANPFTFGDDIALNYGFCDTLVSVDSTYASYNWSNGDTSHFSRLIPGNSYQLTVTSKFGCEFVDDISVQIPLLPQNDVLLCLGDTFVWNTGLSTSTYEFAWSNGSIDSAITTAIPGDYSVLITDSMGCSLRMDTVNVQYDSTLFGITLGADTAVCQGEPISLINPIPAIQFYQWSTTDTTSILQIDTSGTYILTFSDGNCIASDTIDVTIKGLPPTANFRKEGRFLRDSIAFFDLSIPPIGDTIVQWDWDFDDSSFSSVQNPKHKYDTTGRYLVHLTVTTNNGCTHSYEELVVISLKPPTVLPDSTFGDISAVRPRDRSIIFNSEVIFQWNSSLTTDTASRFQLTIAADSNFSSLIYNRSNIIALADTVSLSLAQLYYWKVELIRGGEVLLSSNTLRFTFSDLYAWNDLSMLLQADSGLVIGAANAVRSWENLADRNNDAYQNTLPEQPLFVSSVSELNNNPVVRLDGVDDHLAMDTSALIGELFVVTNWNGGATFPNFNGLMTTQTNSFLIQANGSGGNRTDFSLNSFFPNFTINRIPTRDFAPLADYKIINISRTVGFNFDDFFIGRDRSNLNRFWDGDIAEIIGFSNQLNDSAQSLVYEYLCEKYSQPLSLGEDIFIPYGFCDTMMTVDSTYATYSWSNGDTTYFSRLIPGKTYQLTVTNSFGCEFVDDISVQIPLQAQGDEILCLEDTFIWDTQLATSSYAFLWSDNSSDSLLAISNEGDFSVLITDSMGCSIQLDTITVQYDSSLVNLSLGPDSLVCREDLIAVRGVNVPLTYLWSTGSQLATQIIDTTGIYTVEVNNGRCVNADTAIFTLKGEPPRANFTIEDLCVFDSTLLTDQSVVIGPDTLVNWQWDFDDNSQLLGDSVKKRFTSVGAETVQLTVTTNQGCIGDTTISFPIYPKPTADFSISNACAKSPINFFEQSFITAGSIVAYRWNFGDTASAQNISIIQNPMHVYDTLGTYSIELITESNRGCLDTANISKLINPSPIANFRFEGNCLNDSVYFFDESTIASGTIDGYLWRVDVPFQELLVKNPVVKYNNAGVRPMVLRVKSDSMCFDTIRSTIEISENPIAAFTVDTICEGVPFTINNTSTSVDSISSFRYIFNDLDTSRLENPTFVQDTANNYLVDMYVETNKGCIDSTTQSITINPKPQAAFSLLTNNTGIPFNVPIVNNSIGSSNYQWDFGNGDQLNDLTPNYTYQDTGTYSIQLLVSSSFGCLDSTNRSITVLPKFLDATLDRIILSENMNGDLQVFARIINSGFNTIEEIRLVADLNNEFQIKESFTETVYTGNSRGYDFSSAFIQERGRKVDFLCVRIETVNGEIDSITTNNELCERAFNNELVLEVYPNPVDDLLRFEYVLPQDGKVLIRFYDALGREVLKDIELNQQDGYYQKLINVNALNPGLYYYQFIHNGVEQVGNFMKK